MVFLYLRRFLIGKKRIFFRNHDKYHILPRDVLLFLSHTIRGMSVIYLLISISIIVAIAFLYAFLRAVKTGQYDDDYTPSVRMLFDDELVKSGEREEESGENRKKNIENRK